MRKTPSLANDSLDCIRSCLTSLDRAPTQATTPAPISRSNSGAYSARVFCPNPDPTPATTQKRVGGVRIRSKNKKKNPNDSTGAGVVLGYSWENAS